MTHLRFATGPMLAAVLAACGGAALGCGSNKNAADQQFDEMHKVLAKVQADHDRFDERLGALEQAETRRQADEQHRVEAERASAGEGRPKLRVVKVRPDGAVDEEAAPVAEAGPDGSRPVIRATGKAGSAEAPAADSADAKRDYDAAMALVKGKKYEKAIEAFDGFLGRFSDHPRAENAMYWRGECLYAKSDWARAAEQFEAVLARFPQGQKAADTLLKLGLSYSRSGDKDKAKDAFAKLRSQYPKSDAAKQAPRD